MKEPDKLDQRVCVHHLCLCTLLKTPAERLYDLWQTVEQPATFSNPKLIFFHSRDQQFGDPHHDQQVLHQGGVQTHKAHCKRTEAYESYALYLRYADAI